MASPVDTSVKFIHADMPSAPVLNALAGSLLTVLDAFLVSGFGMKSAESGTISSGVCRLNFASGVSAVDKNAVITVAGATPAGLNGEQKVTNFSTAWVEFATDLPDGAVSGTVTFKMAPLGWEKVFSKTNVAVYRPTDISGTRPYLRVDDTGATFARVTMYESMTDVDTGFNMAPAAATVTGGYYWWKRTSAGATGTQYAIVGDSRGVYVGPMPGQDSGKFGVFGYTVSYAGDLNSYRSGDAFCAMLTGGNSSANGTGNASVYGNVFTSDNPNTRTVMRRANGIGSAQTCERTAYGATISGNNGAFGPAPAAVGNGLYMTPIVVSDGGTFAANGPRGALPGAMCSIQTEVVSLLGYGTGQVLGTGAYAGKTMLRLHIDARIDGTQTAPGTGFIDITGPWRGD